MEIRLKGSSHPEVKKIKSKCRRYFSHYSLYAILGTIWIVSTAAGYISHHLSILLFICLLSMIKPLLKLTTKVLGTHKLTNETALKLSTKIIAIGIVFGLSAVFFPFVNNINYFFPSFGIVTSLIFMAIFIASRFKIYFLVSIISIVQAIYIGYHYPNNFMMAGYAQGITMLTLGVYYGLVGKIAKFSFNKLKRQHKENLNSPIIDKEKNPINKSPINKEF